MAHCVRNIYINHIVISHQSDKKRIIVIPGTVAKRDVQSGTNTLSEFKLYFELDSNIESGGGAKWRDFM